jgi:hypothetical protein
MSTPRHAGPRRQAHGHTESLQHIAASVLCFPPESQR